MAEGHSSPRDSLDAGASRARHAGLSTLVLLAPACLLFALFVIYPILRNIDYSFYDD